MFDHLFPLLGSSGTALWFLTVLGLVATVVLSEVLGVAFTHAFSHRRRPRLT